MLQKTNGLQLLSSKITRAFLKKHFFKSTKPLYSLATFVVFGKTHEKSHIQCKIFNQKDLSICPLVHSLLLEISKMGKLTENPVASKRISVATKRKDVKENEKSKRSKRNVKFRC